ncbi:Maf family nucleotide pyrophosphatase, partial [bacterium]|nr:Maf family nucleotide pyrophosphatase [bacterium]
MNLPAPLILGSSSPRRKEILSLFDFTFTIDGADIDESQISEELSPAEYTKTLAKRKNEALQNKHPGCIIISADTIVYHEGKFLGKPKNEEQAFAAIKSLCGKTHIVGTAVALSYQGKTLCEFEETKVTLRELTNEQIHQYIKTFHPLDKAGSYGIQDGAGILIQKIEGNFHNV